MGLMDRGREPLSSHWATGLWVRGPVATQSQREPSPAPAQPSASDIGLRFTSQKNIHRRTAFPNDLVPVRRGFPFRTKPAVYIFLSCFTSKRIYTADFRLKPNCGVYFFIVFYQQSEYTPQISFSTASGGVYFFIGKTQAKTYTPQENAKTQGKRFSHEIRCARVPVRSEFRAGGATGGV